MPASSQSQDRTRNQVTTQGSNNNINLTPGEIGKWLLSKDFSIIPLARCDDANNCKKPLAGWSEYQQRKPTLNELSEWVNRFGNKLGGWAIVCGPASGNLLVLGFEHYDAYEWFKNNAPDFVKYLLDSSMRVLSGIRSDGKRGVHVYIRVPPSVVGIRNIDILLPININAQDPNKKEPLNKLEVRYAGRYVVAPGYRHYSGVNYCIEYGPLDTPAALRCNNFVGVPDELLWDNDPATIQELVDYIAKLASENPSTEQPQEAQPVTPQPQVLPAPTIKVIGSQGTTQRVIEDKQIEDVINLFKSYNVYKEGHRNFIAFFLSGALLKAGFDTESIKRLIERLATEFGDKEVKQRIKLVDYQYKWVQSGRKALKPEDVEELKKILGREPPVIKGWSGLQEEVAKILVENGMTLEDAAKNAKEFIKKIKRALGINIVRIRQIRCLKRKEGHGCVKMLIVKDPSWDNNYEVAIRSLTKNGWTEEFYAELPKNITRIYDLFYEKEFYIAYVDDKRIVADEIEEFVNKLKNRLVGIDRVTKEIIDTVKKVAVETVGYISPGITEEGIIDPNNELDLTDYGIEGLVEAHRWITKYYPPSNAYKALANVAFLAAKIISPLARKHVKTFVDHIIWNYGRGRVPISEGKSSLADYVLGPLLGAKSENMFIIMKGAVSTEAQLRDLISLNRLPLVLDEQTRDKLKKNASLFIASPVGLGPIAIHAGRYGNYIGAKFINYRGIIIFTNVTFREFLNDAKELASDMAYVRRVLPINWENEPLDPKAFNDLPRIKPILGTINNVFLKYRDQLINTKDLIDLAITLLNALKNEYAKTDEEKKVIDDYINAVERVVDEANEERLATIRDDDELLVEAAYEFARKLGIQTRSAMDVIDAILNNPSLSGIELVKARWANDIEDIKKRVLELFHLGPNEDYVTSHKVPNSVANALLEGKVYVWIQTHALGGRIPSRQYFMGKQRIHDSRRNINYYRMTLDEFLRPFFKEEAEEEEEEGSNTSSNNGEASDNKE